MRAIPRRSSAIIVRETLLALGVSLFLSPSGGAIELPAREVFLGEKASFRLADIDSFENTLIRFESRYWDLYRMKSARRFHDYHESDFRAAALFKRRWLLHGLAWETSSLSLENGNVFTDADRMSGGRRIDAGSILFGVDGIAKRFPGDPALRALGAVGWGKGAEAAFDASLAWGERSCVRASARTFATGIDVYEEIGGHRYPFRFPFRADRFEGGLSFNGGAFQTDAFGGSELSHGDDDGSSDWENELYFRRISFGGSLSYRIRVIPGAAPLLRRLAPGSSLPGLSLTIDRSLGSGDLGMSKQGVRYLYLHDVEVHETSVRLDFVPRRSVYCSAGWARRRLQHDGDSFLEVWPFSIWDVFAAKQYRLGPVDGCLDTWFLGAGCMTQRRRLDAELQARLYRIDGSSSLRWFEREDVFYPFVFEFVAHDETSAIAYRFAVQAEPSLTIRATERIAITISGGGTLPFGREKEEEKGEPPTPGQALPKEARSSHGGLIGMLILAYSL